MVQTCSFLRRPPLLLLGLGSALLVSCQTAPKPDTRGDSLRWQFKERLTLATRAIQTQDLEQAKSHLRSAQEAASSPYEQRKVRSLQQLIAGAEALREGDGAAARAHWTRIEDPILHAEVRAKAQRIGIEMPAPGDDPVARLNKETQP